MGWEISIKERSWNKCSKADAEKRILADSKKYNYDPIKMLILLQETSPQPIMLNRVKSAFGSRITRLRYRRD